MDSAIRRIWRITGLVQGVGFRPTLWRVAHDLSLTGTVYNDAAGVTATVEGPVERVELFVDALRRLVASDAPLARIDSVTLLEEGPAQGFSDFTITESRGGRAATMVTPDAATCRACAADMFDPANRRYRYAFTNCTHCGPRFTITRRIPYDRAQTSMAPFAMCPDCLREYGDPSDRRFHAQPNACPVCGPQLSLADAQGAPVACGDVLAEVVRLLRSGAIVAVKGLGGFHLACDALNPSAVERLRQRKGRDEKPFAVMFANARSASRFAEMSDVHRELLNSVAHPVVLCPQTPAVSEAMPGVAQGLTEIGVMLPYTPVHLLLFHEAAGRPAGLEWLDEAIVEDAWVMTSANPSGEPLVTDNDEALSRLSSIADYFLMHNRAIVSRCDDSVLRVVDDVPRFVRRSRGYTPTAVKTALEVDGIVATGAALKVTAALGRANEAFVTEHVGETDNPATCSHLKQTLEHFLDILEVDPKVLACDLHPDFYSTQLALEMADVRGLPVTAVQHHHAHTAAVAHESGVTDNYWGLSLDGVGLGTDGAAWGGELLYGPGDGTFERRAHLQPMALPGGDKAAREPRRMGAALCSLAGRTDLIDMLWPAFAGLPMAQLISNPRLTRSTTSMGRLFDGAAAVAGLCEIQHDEARAAMLLEAAAQPFGETLPVAAEGFTVSPEGVLSFAGLVNVLLDMRLAGRAPGEMAALFHGTVAAGLAHLVERTVPAGATVCLSGGCFLNRLLAHDVPARLRQAGYTVLLPQELPPGDGAVSFGQLTVAAERVRAGKLPAA